MDTTRRTSRLVRTAGAALALALTAGCGGDSELGTPVADADPSGLPGRLVVEADAIDPSSRWAEVWGRDGMLAEIAGDLGEMVHLPEDVTVRLEVDGDGPYYDPLEKEVHLPVGFADMTADDLAGSAVDPEDVDDLVAANVAFVLLHEVGHAFIDVLELPITAREEDSVDALGVVLMADADLEETGFGGDKSFSGVPLAAALVFDLLAVDAEYDESDYWDEHSLGAQRAATIACLTYGADPDGNAGMEPYLDEHRAPRCEMEYAQVAHGWGELLDPYLVED